MQRYTAIVLASRDIGEYDRLYTIYTQEAGLTTAVGKGVRKLSAKLAGHLESATLSEIYVARSRGIGQITSALTISSFEDIKKNFPKLDEVLKIFYFFTRNFSEGEKDRKIFDLLREFLFLSAEFSSNGDKILLEAFWWKLFDFLGHRPETMKCAVCAAKLENEGRKFFSAEKGGIICGKCSIGEKGFCEITSNQIKLLRVFLANYLDKILKVKASEVELSGLERIRKEFERYNF